MAARYSDRQRADAFAPLLWSIPLSVLVHNFEEYPRIVDYARRHGVAIGRRQNCSLLPGASTAGCRQPGSRRGRRAPGPSLST